jgi:uncharacterized protein
MDVSTYSPLHALIGGILIGLGTLLGTIATGKPIGISGIFSNLLRRKSGEGARSAIFLGGLIAGAILAEAIFSSAVMYRPEHSLATLALAGLLVGFGTRLGGGCTSGHGVCGIGLGSKSGIVATLLFMVAGMGTVYVMNHLLGGAA